MTNNLYSTKPENIYNALNQRKICDNQMFLETPPVCFWRLSDLALLYPDFFNIKNTISQQETYEINKHITNLVPKLKNLTPTPIHVLTIKDNYVIHDYKTQRPRLILNGTNQYLTSVACEYLFKKFDNTETEQAYFLSTNNQNSNPTELIPEIKIERIRNQVSFNCRIFSSLIKNAQGANKFYFASIWKMIWDNIYGVNVIDTLQQRYNVKTTIIDHMSFLSLNIVNQMLQKIIFKYRNSASQNIQTLMDITQRMAILTNNTFAKYNTHPLNELSHQNTHNRIKKLNHVRIKFWNEYYPKSL